VKALLRGFVVTALLNKAAEVPARKTDKLRHFTIMGCFDALGMEPLPMIVAPNLVLAPAQCRAFRECGSFTSTKNGWVNCEGWVEWASDSANGWISTGHVTVRRDF
jgi:hypothetical protein